MPFSVFATGVAPGDAAQINDIPYQGIWEILGYFELHH